MHILDLPVDQPFRILVNAKPARTLELLEPGRPKVAFRTWVVSQNIPELPSVLFLNMWAFGKRGAEDGAEHPEPHSSGYQQTLV